MRHDAVLKLVDLVYAAAYDPAAWRPFLELLSKTMNAAGADVGVFGHATGAQIHTGVGIVGREFLEEYAAHYWEDPYLLAAQAQGLFRTGTIGLGEQIVPRRELQRSSFFNDFGKRHDYCGGVSAIVASENELFVSVNVCQSRNAHMGAPQVKLMQTLMPHLQRAIQIHLRLAQADMQVRSLEAMVNTVAVSAILVEGDGRIVFINDSARELLARRDGITIDHQELRAAYPADTQALRRLITDATAAGAGRTGGGILLLRRPSFRQPLHVVVAPAPVEAALLLSRGRAIVFVNDPEQLPDAGTKRLQRLFGFSRTEAAVAVELLAGKSPREIAAHADISINTVRFHLKQLFSKTGTSRQAELVRLLSTAAHVRSPKERDV